MLGPIKIARLVSVLLFLFGLYLLFRKKKDTRLNRLKEKLEDVKTKFYHDYYNK
jgi:hypothetical protein